ncbi:MAG: chorismate mutase [Pyrinomonadaceae bacterium]|nr:chorismate mutase [Pyrinomonadaceae bacterium]MCX7640614.1 chorismate mutase [Pyrinomonadaceae bacterium]MDW8305158.1 chorismate mutase [Acidobacteriota bacterium]
MIEDWRREIDMIDAEIVRLINQRAVLCRKIGIFKLKKQLPVVDLQREKQILENALSKNAGFISNDALERIFKVLIRESRNIQIEAQSLEKL